MVIQPSIIVFPHQHCSREGCAMSCVAMALNAYNVTADGDAVNPGTLNSWLKNNSGYQCLGGDCNNLVLDAPSRRVNCFFLIFEIDFGLTVPIPNNFLFFS